MDNTTNYKKKKIKDFQMNRIPYLFNGKHIFQHLKLPFFYFRDYGYG